MIKLRIEGLTAGYDGKIIFDGVNMEINSGEIVGLIGSNGAGKTTLIKTILGIVSKERGVIEIDGMEVNDDNRQHARLAYIPEIPLLYDELTLLEHMEFTAMANGINKGIFEERKNRLLELFNMKEKVNDFPNSFSKGMKQKVLVMCSFLYNPSLLVVDEPFIGLDPKAQASLIKLLEERRSEGTAILMSTHVLDSAERICQRFILINAGRIIFKGTLEEMRAFTKRPQGSLMELYNLLVEGL